MHSLFSGGGELNKKKMGKGRLAIEIQNGKGYNVPCLPEGPPDITRRLGGI